MASEPSASMIEHLGRRPPRAVIPAQAGNQSTLILNVLDSRRRGNDGYSAGYTVQNS